MKRKPRRKNRRRCQVCGELINGHRSRITCEGECNAAYLKAKGLARYHANRERFLARQRKLREDPEYRAKLAALSHGYFLRKKEDPAWVARKKFQMAGYRERYKLNPAIAERKRERERRREPRRNTDHDQEQSRRRRREKFLLALFAIKSTIASQIETREQARQ